MPEQLDPGFEALLDYLRDNRGADFTGYKRPSLTRLVARRMSAVGIDDFAAYTDFLQVEPSELPQLLDALLINVTAFFRDGQPWETLREHLLPTALAGLGPDEPIRAWSAACASGEEAYTIAILLHELVGEAAFKNRVKIYATDVDEEALTTARSGWYSAKALASVGEERRATYFEPDGGGFRFRSDLRPSLIFGRHDLLQDAPISRVLLLSCRNALMYFTAETQTRVLERLAFALRDGGLLLLGKAEMLLTQSQLFAPVSLPDRIFRAQRPGTAARRLTGLAVGGSGVRSDVHRVAEAAFVAAPAAQVVLDADGLVTIVNERAQRDLGVSAADVGRQFHDLALSTVPLELRGAVASVQASGSSIEMRDVEWPANGGPSTRWDVRIAPLEDIGQVLGVHVVFEDVTERHALQTALDTVHGELTTAYEELQSSSEELETTNEELQSAVEELETTNEELQSTNEELETMNEELQSTNEELQTLNDELRERTAEVNEANSFLHSILEGVDLAVAVVDSSFHVQLWNVGAERLTGLRAFEAEGLPLLDLDLRLPLEPLRDLLRDVVAGSDPATVTGEVETSSGSPVRRQLTATALRTNTGSVRGAVVTLADSPG